MKNKCHLCPLYDSNSNIIGYVQSVNLHKSYSCGESDSLCVKFIDKEDIVKYLQFVPTDEDLDSINGVIV